MTRFMEDDAFQSATAPQQTVVESSQARFPWVPEAITTAVGPIMHDAQPVGSRVTCFPAPEGTDEDWLVVTFRNPAEAMAQAGFTQDGSPEFYTGNDAGGFRSWRIEGTDLNVITTESHEFFDRFMTATYLARRFNLLDKADRISLFQAVLYGVNTDGLEAQTTIGRRSEALWPAEAHVAECDAAACAAVVIGSGAENADYTGGTRDRKDDLFWNRVHAERDRIASWAVQGLGITGRAR